MKCRNCKCCHEVVLSRWSNVDNAWVTEAVHKCYGVKEPFIINDIDVECTEYPEYREKTVEDISIEKAISHFKYGISHDIFKEPVTSYAKMAVAALDKRILKKPIGDLHSVPHYRCPNCNGAVAVYEYDFKYPNCKWCGQAIDWT